jgi:hypothetical protein
MAILLALRDCGRCQDCPRYDGARRRKMEAIVFFVVWLGGAVLHTLFDLRIKPVLQAVREESDLP